MYNILLVDDEKLTLDYLSLSIPRQNDGWIVSKTCYDGFSALEWLKENKADLIITDIKMPEMSGLELCQTILKDNPQQKIIILSGYDEFQFAQQAIKFGVKEYLLKPISLSDLKEALNSMKNTLDVEQTEEYMYNSLLKLSEEGKVQIVSRFIQAVINNSYVETKSLHPIVHRMKISLLDGAGIIMLISLDEDILLSKGIPVSDIPLYKYIIYRLTVELAEESTSNIWVSLDHNEDVVVLLSAETYEQASGLANDFLFEIHKNKFPNMELPLSASQSSSFEDILMMDEAYQEASIALNCRLFDRSGRIYTKNNVNELLQSRIEKLNLHINALYAALISEQVSEQVRIIDSIIALLPDDSQNSRVAISQYLIKSLTASHNQWNKDDILYILSLIPQLSLEPDVTLRKYLLKLIHLLSTHKYSSLCVSGSKTPEAGIIHKAKQYIHSHYASPISLALIAEEIGVSPNYLSTLFHNEVGESYIKYLTGIRMKNAVSYMRTNPELKIYEIAEKVGYVNVKHFSYVFKQYYSVSPGEYQQTMTASEQ